MSRWRAALLCLGLSLGMAPLIAQANRWNEPWHREVVAQSDLLGLFEVESVEGRSAVVRLEQWLAGERPPERLTISGYHLLRVVLATSKDWKPWLKPRGRYYLLLKKTGNDEWLLPTPSAGSDELRANGRVAATYRLSLQKAEVPREVYESTQICIFGALHGRPCDDPQLLDLLGRQLRLPLSLLTPGSDAEASDRRFLHHAALETFALAGLPVDEDVLRSLLVSRDFQTQISALQLLVASDPPDRLQRLSAFVCGDGNTAMARSMAVLLLDRLKAKSETAALQACAARLPDDATYLGSGADARAGTEFPASPRQGVKALLDRWERQRTAPADPLGALRESP